jgi:ATP-dependent DNA ligase
MEALAVDEIPIGAEWQYEPKWDGFRCLLSKHGRRIEMKSKAGKSLARYFPEIVDAAGGLDIDEVVLDGELAIPSRDAFSFDDLLQRIHPAASRIERLSRRTPAIFIVFDLLVTPDDPALFERPLNERRKKLEAFAARYLDRSTFRLSPVTDELADAKSWLRRTGRMLDGIIAKRKDLPYRFGLRDGMQKIKNYRSADCVVGGFRYNEGKPTVGSLLLGLYGDDGLLHHVGFTSTLPAAEKPALTRKLRRLIAPPGFSGAAPGGPSRWSTERSSEWQPLRPKLVVEVCYDHFSGGRFRHGTRLTRWRPDKAARQCTFDQVRQRSGNVLGLLNW